MTLKKVLSVAALSAAVGSVALVTSCGTSTTKEESKTIVFYNTAGSALQDVISTAIEKFEAKFPEYTVTSTQVGGYDDVKSKIMTDLTADTQPDVAYCYADHVASYLSSETVIDLNGLINNTGTVTTDDGTQQTIGFTSSEVSDFVSTYYNEGLATNYSSYSRYGYSADSMLTLPFSKSTEVMYYNKTALDALGIEVPTTWAEMWAACAKIKTTYPDSAPLVYDSEANWFITACEQNDWDYTTTDTTNHYLFNNENTQNFLTELKGYYDLGYFQTATTANVSYTSSLFTAGIETTCFCIGSSAGASYQQPSNNLFEVGIAPIPGYAKEGSGVISQGPSLVMFDQNGDNSTLSEKEVMTFQFVKELMDPSFQSSFSQASGYMPVRTSTYDLDSYAEFLADTDNIKAVAANVAKSLNAYYYTSAVFNGSATARTQVGSALVYAVQGTKTAAEALADAYKNCGGK